MISFEDAKKIAWNRNSAVEFDTEESDAYLFIDRNIRQDGTIVVLKETGKILGYSEYLFNNKKKG